MKPPILPIVYSKKIKGARGTYNWPARFDWTDGFVGITQFKDNRNSQRVLLTPAQVAKLVKFIKECK
jgi:hypothetical protein